MSYLDRLMKRILLIPGPVTTSYRVKNSMMLDYSAREPLFISVIKNIRENLLNINKFNPKHYTSILFQGSGTYANEAVISSIPKYSKINIYSNGIYGERLYNLAKKYDKHYKFIELNPNQQITADIVEESIKDCSSTHIALAHCETTSCIENPVNDIIPIAKKYNKKIIIDAISSYGGIPIINNEIDYLVGSSNKCLHGLPGIGFVIVNRKSLEECRENPETVSLDLYSQYLDFEKEEQFRFTPPVQILNALDIALKELIDNGGIKTRMNNYNVKHNIVYNKLVEMGFKSYIPKEMYGNIGGSYYIPKRRKQFDFNHFADYLNKHNIVVYPSALDDPRIIRIGNIGNITIEELYFCLKKFEHYF